MSFFPSDREYCFYFQCDKGKVAERITKDNHNIAPESPQRVSQKVPQKVLVGQATRALALALARSNRAHIRARKRWIAAPKLIEYCEHDSSTPLRSVIGNVAFFIIIVIIIVLYLKFPSAPQRRCAAGDPLRAGVACESHPSRASHRTGQEERGEELLDHCEGVESCGAG